MLPAQATPAEWVAAAEVAAVPCKRCGATGKFRSYGDCFRCNGKGYQTVADARRNWGHDKNAASRG